MNAPPTRAALLDQASSAPRGSQPQLTKRGWRTRSALVAAARELFEQRGFRETRISDIAERSRTSYGTFYHYFDSKEAVLDDLFTTVAGEMFNASQMRKGVKNDPVAKIEASNRQYFAVAARNAGIIAVIEEMAIRDARVRNLKLQMRELFLRRNEAGIKSLQRAGLVDRRLDAKITASALGGMIEHFTQMWLIHHVTFDEETAVATLTQLWAQALGLPYQVADASAASA